MSARSLGPEDRSKLTARQMIALEGADERIRHMLDVDLGRWLINYQEESRPGRGHDISAWASDGEHMATQYLDPYGNGPLVLCALELLHNDADEDHFDEYGDCEHEQQPYQAKCGSWDCRAPECGRMEP